MMRQKKIFSFVIAMVFAFSFFVYSSFSYAQVKPKDKKPIIEASAAVSKPVAQIGDKVTYAITVKTKKDIEVEFPQLLSEDVGGLAIKDFGLSEKVFFKDKTLRKWYFLDTYVTGEHMLPPAIVKYRVKGDIEWQELKVEEAKLEVKSVLDEAQVKGEIRDIAGPKSFPGKAWFYVLLATGIIMVFGLIFGVIYFRNKREEQRATAVPAHIIAYEALSALEKKDYITQGRLKAYYIELSDIVRHYLENRFNIRAPEMTTEEFLLFLSALGNDRKLVCENPWSSDSVDKKREECSLLPEHKVLLRDFLTNCDLVKFAKYQPAEQEASLSFSSAKRLVDQTKVQEGK